ncbi:MAG: YeeE/YedE family protein [Candidatus Delongbacteria bacterium]|nr:YeeE/YedE family protein [Candidatus Delongbacteria bacterium]
MFNKGILRGLYDSIFAKSWPMWFGGVLLAILNLLLFVIKYPWGGSGGYLNIGQNLFGSLGFESLQASTAINMHTVAILNIMIVLGAFVSSLFSKEFSIKIAPFGELVKGFIGGALMGIGAIVGVGCTTGGFFTGVPALSGGALFLTAGFLIGTFLAMKYILWEMEAFPNVSMGKSYTLIPGTKKGMGWQRWLAWVLLAGIFYVISSYNTDGSSGMKILGWHIIIGLTLGLILQRSRFCIVRAFREPFMTGESEAPVSIMLSLLILIFGFTVLKYFGVGNIAETAVRAIEMKAVYPSFWSKALIGGVIFGLGMTIAGGCAIGTLWRAGEGHIKLWMAILGFTIMAPITKKFIVPVFESFLPKSEKIFLPDYLGYTGSVLMLLGLILLAYIFVKWNEKTGKFSAL